MKDVVYYFGYGILKNQDVVKEIIGTIPKGGYGGILEGFDLGYQNLDQIPEPSKKILFGLYGFNFKAYTIRKGNGYISGIIWELNQKEFNFIKEWEFVGVWRNVISVPIKLFNGHLITSFTTSIFYDQTIKGYIDSINYETNLNPQGKKQLYENKDKIMEIELIRKQIKILRTKK